MTHVAYGVWDGVVYDSRTGAADTQTPEYALQNFDEFDDGNQIRAFFGDRGFFVFDATVSIVDALYHYMTKAAEQSCGACTPCRMGTVLVRDALDKMRRSLGSTLSLDDIEMLGEQMRQTSLCGLGQSLRGRAARRAAQFPRPDRGRNSRPASRSMPSTAWPT